MTCINFAIDTAEKAVRGILCVDPGVGPYRITVGKQRWWFEWSDRWGPLRVTRGGGTAEQPGWRSPFWRAACIWNAQGRRTNLQNALWHEPPPITHYYRLVGKRTRLLVETDTPPGSIEGYSEERYVAIAMARDSAETACPAPVPQDCQARAGTASPARSRPNKPGREM